MIVSTHRCRVLQGTVRYTATAAVSEKTAAAAPPPPPLAAAAAAAARGQASAADARVHGIVDDISGLTLLQAADLVAALKARLNIQEIAAPVAAAPVAAAPAAVEEAPVEEKPKEKTIFSVKLESFEATAKPKIIREVKALIPNLNLIEAKKFVESVPKTIKDNLPKEDAEKLKATLEALGAKVTLE
ncbi:ribosomal protein L7/L12 C-terminal domain-containing protein [Hysterangium stoloniferum]|nr:ribosomal protein L7/L12 C-terminal domain-containing protein [Hysterangium stoloniferum]